MPSLRYKHLIALMSIFLGLSCGGRPSEADLEYLQGYWEIRRVIFPEGQQKDYVANSTVEYLDWNGEKGFRKKLQPTMLGTYLTSDDALPMDILWRDGRLFLSFSGGDKPWEEEVLQLNKEILITRHENGLHYEYIRYEPLIKPEVDG